MNNEGVAVLLMPGYSCFDLAAIVDCFKIADRLTKNPRFQLDLYAEAGGAVAAAGDVLQVDGAPLSSAWPHRLLLVLLGQDGHDRLDDGNRSRISVWLGAGSRVILVGELAQASRFCDGSFVLQPFHRTVLQTRGPIGMPLESGGKPSFVDHISSGVTVLDGVLAYIGEQHSIELMLRISSSLLQRGRRSREQLDSFERALRKALPWVGLLLDEVAETAGLPRKVQLAASIGLSVRQLERACKRYLQMTPMQFVRLLRLHRAHESVLYSDLSVAEIARRAGFLSQSHFSNSYRHQFGRPPTVARRMIHTSPFA